jgi:hypothetical protein
MKSLHWSFVGLTFEAFVEKSKQAFSTVLVAHYPLAGQFVVSSDVVLFLSLRMKVHRQFSYHLAQD